MEALTLLGDSELRTLGLPLGPRMKMLSAIEERRKAMSDEQILQDSQLWERIYIFEIKNCEISFFMLECINLWKRPHGEKITDAM